MKKIIRQIPVRAGAVLLLLSIFFVPTTRALDLPTAGKLPASITQVIPIGKTTGIKLKSEGVIVAGMSEIAGPDSSVPSPAETAGLKKGDVVASINGEAIKSGAQVQQLISKSKGQPIQLVVKRAETPITLTVTPVLSSENEYKIGVMLRDSLMGIGTITFYEPNSGLYGALGHGISDPESQSLLPIADGVLIPSKVSDVTKGQSGTPGELHGEFTMDQNSGSVLINSQAGIYGYLNPASITSDLKPLPIGTSSEVQEGKAQILSNVAGGETKLYDVTILKLSQNTAPKDMLIEVTDQELLDTTGGIVQGMSGSPIIQNGKIIGAVTQVLVSDPKRGYGIFIESMLDMLRKTDSQSTAYICA